jgi:molecular chaperone HscB
MAATSSMASFAARDYFSLFGLPVRFAIDLAALDSAWRAVQGAVHPDKFVGANDAQKLLALQMSTQINEAHTTLKNPILRASYICKLHGVTIDPERNTAMPADFLVQQMEWRESLEDAAQAGNIEAIAELSLEVAAAVAESEVLIEHLLDQSSPDFARAAEEIRRLMFLTKFSEQVRGEQKRSTDGTSTDR